MSDAIDPNPKSTSPRGARLVFLQIPMAISAASLIAAIAFTLGRPLEPAWYLAAFLGTWCVYLRDSAASWVYVDGGGGATAPRRTPVATVCKG